MSPARHPLRAVRSAKPTTLMVIGWVALSFTLGVLSLAHGDASPLVLLAAIGLMFTPDLAQAVRARRSDR